MLTASIVAYHNPLAELQRVVNCILASPIDILYIIDNSSNDSLRELAGGSNRIRYIHSENLGFGVGHNIAIGEICEKGSKYHVVINPDVYFTEGVIESLTKYMDQHTEIGLIMPKVLYPDGEMQYLCKLLPTPRDLLIRRFLFGSKMEKKRNLRYELRFADYNNIMAVPSLSGCFMFFRTETLAKVRGFDEQYFMYLEDLDICRRIGQIADTVYYPLVHIYHAYEKGSYKNLKLMKYHITSAIKYFNRWGWFYDRDRKKINKRILKELNYKPEKCNFGADERCREKMI